MCGWPLAVPSAVPLSRACRLLAGRPSRQARHGRAFHSARPAKTKYFFIQAPENTPIFSIQMAGKFPMRLRFYFSEYQSRNICKTSIMPLQNSALHRTGAQALSCSQMAAAAATFSDSSPPGWAMRICARAWLASAASTPCPSCPISQAHGQGKSARCSHCP